jgi:hypothetical protein
MVCCQRERLVKHQRALRVCLAPSGPPIPQPGYYRHRQAALQLPGRHDDLSTMMRLMRDEVGQDMPDVQRQITPHVRPGWWYATPPLATQSQKSGHAATASLQSRAQFPGSNGPVIHPLRGDDAVRMAQGLDPGAPRVVKMGSNRPDRAGRHSGDGRGP